MRLQTPLLTEKSTSCLSACPWQLPASSYSRQSSTTVPNYRFFYCNRSRTARSLVVTRATEDPVKDPAASELPAVQPELVAAPREDDVLPDSLTDALFQASEATWSAIQKGTTRCTIEILLADFWDPISGPVFSEEGDNMRWWKLNRKIADNLQQQSGSTKVKVIFPDIGVATMLKNAWPDASFSFASLNDRRPVSKDDELIILAAPDPQGVDDVIRVADDLISEGQTLVMFNPRLASGDVGLGLNVRRLRDRFLSTFVTTYSLRPISEIGSVFRKYPGMWQVFLNDEQSPGRYKLVAERPSRPAGDALDLIISDAMGVGADGEKTEAGFGQQLVQTVASLSRFMKSLSG